MPRPETFHVRPTTVSGVTGRSSAQPKRWSGGPVFLRGRISPIEVDTQPSTSQLTAVLDMWVSFEATLLDVV